MMNTKEMDLNELGMYYLQQSRQHFIAEREKARAAKINTELSLKDINSLIMARNEAIAEMERKGVKKHDLDEIEPDGKKPAEQQEKVN